MGKSGIEYCTDGWTVVSGCEHFNTAICGTYCWAAKLAKRNPKAHPKGFSPMFHSRRLEEPLKLKGNKVIFTCHTGDLFGNWVPDIWIMRVLDIIKQCPQHTFLMLTKNPARMQRFFNTCNRQVPENVWLGTSVTTDAELIRISQLPFPQKGGHRWVSFEPLLEPDYISKDALALKLKQQGIEQVIIGAQTAPYIEPKFECFKTIYTVCKSLNIPVFVKDNMEKFLIKRDSSEFYLRDLAWRK